MKYSLKDQADGISICIEGVEGREHEIVNAIRECRKSSWACTSGECRNIDAMDDRTENGIVYLTLTPRGGEKISLRGIEECLGYMLGRNKPESGK